MSNKLLAGLILVLVVVGAYFAYTAFMKLKPGPRIPETERVRRVYFGHSKKGGEDCGAVFPVEREIYVEGNMEKNTLRALLKGPTDEEEDQGYFTSINSGVEVNSLNIENDKAEVDFSSDIEDRVGGSCRVSAIKAQIKETLKQFSTVNEVEISVAGQTEGILQP